MKNCIVKIVNGVPVVFGEAGKDDMDSLVYIFEEEEAFNAALDAGLIPVGTLIVKTYDEVEMAGGPFDDALSDVSENAVQNKVIKAEFDNMKQSAKVYRANEILIFDGELTLYEDNRFCTVSVLGPIVNINIIVAGSAQTTSSEGIIRICGIPNELDPFGYYIFESLDNDKRQYQVRAYGGSGNNDGELFFYSQFEGVSNAFIPINITYARKM